MMHVDVPTRKLRPVTLWAITGKLSMAAPALPTSVGVAIPPTAIGYEQEEEDNEITVKRPIVRVGCDCWLLDVGMCQHKKNG
jgi:hypothetical protein